MQIFGDSHINALHKTFKMLAQNPEKYNFSQNGEIKTKHKNLLICALSF